MTVDTLYGAYTPESTLTAETFDDLFERCRPTAETESWTEIPWIGTL